MTTKNKNIIQTTAIIATLSIGFYYFIKKYKSDVIRKFRVLCDLNNPLKNQVIEIVNDEKQCREVVNQLKNHCTEYNVLGFDCEWVTVGGSRRPIALLQLASHKGLCALIRLCNLQKIPTELRELLENDDIIKVGVAPHDDARYLSLDYSVGVASTLDLRHLANFGQFKPEGLAKMALTHLNVIMDKNWRVRCSDWEATELSHKQIEYAAKDAHVAIELFKKIENNISQSYIWSSKATKRKNLNKIMMISYDYLDMKYKANSNFDNNIKNVSINNFSGLKTTCGRVPKDISRKMCTRANSLYDNCVLQAPDGETLATVCKKKAEWYLYKDLGIKISDDPLTVRLKFEPAGRAVGEIGKYYTQEKINQCVVCGKTHTYIRKNIVPREYRKLFPAIMKEHSSHDVLLLCSHCHQMSNISDIKLRERLNKMCDAPINNMTVELIPKMGRLRSVAKALLQTNKIPEDRLKCLREEFLTFYPGKSEITNEMLLAASEINTTKKINNYCSHGQIVVDYFKDMQSGGLIELERMWRQHFIDTMKPKFLPDLWSITHNANRLEIRADEGRIEKEDLIVAGLDPILLELSNKNKTDTFLQSNNTMTSDICDISNSKTIKSDANIFNISNIDNYDSDATNSLLSQPSSTTHSDVEEDFDITT